MSKEAMKLAKAWFERNTYGDEAVDVYEALCEALAEQPAQQEPVAWVTGLHAGRCVIKTINPAAILPVGIALYTSPQPAQRAWVGLTDEEITDIWAESSPYYHKDDFARAIEAKLRSKNNG